MRDIVSGSAMESGREIESGGGESRRGFFGTAFLWLGLSSLAASLATTLYANFRFFFPKVLYEPPAQFKAGLPSDYQAGTVSDRWVKEHQVWVIREDDTLYAMLTVCTHLGCLTGFFPAEGLFKCPCHGSNFSLQGDPVAGPAPVPLYRLAMTLGEDGQIVVDKNQQENRPGVRDQPPFVLKV
ncbi:MAG: ubiquinol-cytochrome c reductase iron-sulfur subunit [Thermoguttaceae bacterium]